MNIGIFTSRALPKIGGLEIVVDELARGLAARGHQVTVAAPRPKWWKFPRDRSLPYQVQRYAPFISKRYAVSWHRPIFSRLLACGKFDVVHCHDLYPQAYLCCDILERFRDAGHRPPVVLTSHGSDVMADSIAELPPAVQDKVRISAGRIAAFVACSESMLAQFAALDQTGVARIKIGNGVDIAGLSRPASRPLELPQAISKKHYVLFLGRLTKRKGGDCLLRALALIPRQSRPALVVAGGGREKKRLRELSQTLLDGEDVHFVGPVHGEAKAYLLQNCLLSVVPTRTWEACSLVVLESFATGAPVVGTDVPGVADLIDHRRNGLLVPAEQPEALAAAIAELAGDEALRTRLAQCAREAAAGHDWSRIVDCYEQLFESLLIDSTKQLPRPAPKLEGLSR